MAKATRGGSRRRSGGGGRIDVVDTRGLVSERETKQKEVDETLQVFRDVYNDYGEIIDGDIQIAVLGKRDSGVLGYYDGSNIAINETFFNTLAMEASYKQCVEMGFHPSNGNKTALQAVVAHEIGHMLTDKVAVKMGENQFTGIKNASAKIVNEARKKTGDRGAVLMAEKISKYAVESNAEAIAEAFSDVYCNGSKAKKQSRAIVEVLNSYLK